MSAEVETPFEEAQDEFKLNFKVNDELEEESEELHDHTKPHWAHMAFALGSTRWM